MLDGKPPETHRHRCPHRGAYSVCPQAYGEDCPLEGTAPADCRSDPYGERRTLCTTVPPVPDQPKRNQRREGDRYGG
jgi:hypothetical protein